MSTTLYFSLHGAGECNNHCLFCDEGFHKNRLSFDDITNIMKQYQMGSNDRVIFSGGEPTLHNSILELIDYASKRGVFVYMQSNGRRFSDYDFALAAAKSGLRRILIPLYGSQPTVHDYLTQTVGSFEETMQGLKNLFGLRDKFHLEIEINTVICKYNFEWLPLLIQFIRDNFPNVKYFRFCALNMSTVAMTNFSVIGIAFSKTKEIVKQCIDMAVDHGLPIALDYIPPCVLDDRKHAEIYRQERRDSVWEPFVIGYESEHKQKWIALPVQFMPPQCKDCECNNVCKGIYKRYAVEFGMDEFVPFAKTIEQQSK